MGHLKEKLRLKSDSPKPKVSSSGLRVQELLQRITFTRLPKKSPFEINKSKLEMNDMILTDKREQAMH
jgi:hypothetical protein